MVPQIKFTRLDQNPIIKPNPNLAWEIGGVFAPAVIFENKKWRMLYRAFGSDMISRFGYAESDDGIIWKKDPEPRVVPDNGTLEYSGIEDPRIVKLEDKYYITYTAYANRKRFVETRVRILETKDFKKFKHITPRFKNHWRKNDKDGVLFPEKIDGLYHILHRIIPDIQISSSKNLRRWAEHIIVLSPTEQKWESTKIGGGAPPIRTDLGWLIFYHGVSKSDVYSMGVAILDIKIPTIVRYRLPFPLLTPEATYEINGAVPNVVFGTSAIEIDNEYRLYYGAADKVIAVATINKTELLNTLLKYPVQTDIITNG